MNPALSVHKTIEVNASRQHAFDVFTRQIATWWPLDYHIGQLDAVEVVIEPVTGGRWYERAADGSTCDWGRVLLWEPPTRVVLMWQISADWKADSTIESEIDVRFFDEGDARTRVDLEHRRLESFGSSAPQIRDVFDSESGWTGLLRSYTAAADASDADTAHDQPTDNHSGGTR